MKILKRLAGWLKPAPQPEQTTPRVWSKPFRLPGGHMVYGLHTDGRIRQVPFAELQHRGNGNYCLLMEPGTAYVAALNEKNADVKFRRRALSAVASR